MPGPSSTSVDKKNGEEQLQKFVLAKKNGNDANRYAILVAGYDFSWQYNNPKRELPFFDYCINRMRRLFAKDPTLIVIIFDIKTGEVIKFNLEKKIGKNKKVQLIEKKVKILIKDKPFKPIDYEKDYEAKEVDGNIFRILMKTDDKISISDIYQFIQKFGELNKNVKSPDNIIIELSFFSHGIPGGPVLVNTFRQISPRDLDPRVSDFQQEYMKGSKADFLKLAFASDAIVRCFGCAFEQEFNMIIQKIIHHTKYNKIKPENRFIEFPNMTIPFTFSPKELDVINKFDSTFIPTGMDLKKPQTFEKEGKSIKDFFNKHSDKTYYSTIAKHIGKRCIAAFLGTYADEEIRKDPRPSNPIMFIPKFSCGPTQTHCKNFSDDFTRAVNFYQTVFNKEIDQEGLGYGVYK